MKAINEAKYTVNRTHHMTVQRTTYSMYYENSINVRIFLVRHLGEYLINALDKYHYPWLLFYLDLIKYRGFEQ